MIEIGGFYDCQDSYVGISSNNLPPDYTMSQTCRPQHKLIATRTSSASAVDRSEKNLFQAPAAFSLETDHCILWIAGCVGSTTKQDKVLKENPHFIKN